MSLKRPDGADAGKTDSQSTLRLILTLGGAAGMLLGGAWLIRSLAPPGRKHLPPEVIERVGVLPWVDRQQLQVVKWGRKLLLLVVSPAGTSVLSEWDDPAEVDRLLAAARGTGRNEARSAPARSKPATRAAAPRPAAPDPQDDLGPDEPPTYEPNFRDSLRQRWQRRPAGTPRAPAPAAVPAPGPVAAEEEPE